MWQDKVLKAEAERDELRDSADLLKFEVAQLNKQVENMKCTENLLRQKIHHLSERELKNEIQTLSSDFAPVKRVLTQKYGDGLSPTQYAIKLEREVNASLDISARVDQLEASLLSDDKQSRNKGQEDLQRQMDIVLAENNELVGKNARLEAELDGFDSRLNARRDLQNKYANLCHSITDVWHLMCSVHKKGIDSIPRKDLAQFGGMIDTDLVPDVNNAEQICQATKQLISFWEPTKFSTQLHNLTVLGEKQCKSILQGENSSTASTFSSQPYETFKQVGYVAIRRQREVQELIRLVHQLDVAEEKMGALIEASSDLSEKTKMALCPAEDKEKEWRKSLDRISTNGEEVKGPCKPEEELSRSHGSGSFCGSGLRSIGDGGEETFLSVETMGVESPMDITRSTPSRRLSSSLNDVLKSRGACPLGSNENFSRTSPELGKRRSSFKVVDSRLEVTEEALASVFYTFCVYGKRSGPPDLLNGRQFAKMMKDSKLVGKRFNNHSVDILFSKVAKKAKAITLNEWLRALELVAEEIGRDIDWVKKKLVVDGVPSNSGTKAEKNRFYDDKSTWTTTAVNGGPTNVDAFKMNFQDLTNRENKADRRGMTPIRIRARA